MQTSGWRNVTPKRDINCERAISTLLLWWKRLWIFAWCEQQCARLANGFRTLRKLSLGLCVCVCDVRSLSLSCRFLGGNDPRRAKRPPLSDKESPCGDVEKSHHNITLTAREISIVTSPGLTVFLLVIPPPPGLMIKNYSYKYIFSPIPVQIHQIISIIK